MAKIGKAVSREHRCGIGAVANGLITDPAYSRFMRSVWNALVLRIHDNVRGRLMTLFPFKRRRRRFWR